MKYLKYLVNITLLIVLIASSSPDKAQATQISDRFVSGNNSYSPGEEIVEQRTENGKVTYLGGNKFSADISQGPIHYKDNYSDENEQWKDIDLTAVNGRVDKAPYILVVDGAKVTMTDKRTGSVTALELTDTGNKKLSKPSLVTTKGKAEKKDIDTDTDLEITWENARVKVTRVLKSDKSPKDAKFNLSQTGAGITIDYKAEDSSGNRKAKVTTSLVNGVLTERVDTTGLTYPVRVDPVLNLIVSGSANDASVWIDSGIGLIDITNWYTQLGNDGAAAFDSGMRFTGVTIPGSANITTAHIRFRSVDDESADTVRLTLSAQQNENTGVFSTYANFVARTLTSHTVNWTFTTNWITNGSYNSTSIVPIIQELVDDYGGLSNKNIVLFAKDNGSNVGAYRLPYSWDGSSTYCARLYIEYTVDLPVISTVAATSVSVHGAQLNSYLAYDGSTSNTVPCTITFAYIISTSPHANWADISAGTTVTLATTYLGGTNPVKNIVGLAPLTTYYYMVRAVNSAGTAYGAIMSFTTIDACSSPTSLSGIPTATTVSLLWVKGVGSDETMIRYQVGSYPSSNTTGFLAYNATETSVVVPSLTPGTSYYFVAWGTTGGEFSSTNATLMVTTLAGSAALPVMPPPATPSNWFQAPDYTNMSNMPFYSIVNFAADAFETPKSTVWYVCALFFCVAVGIGFYSTVGNANLFLSVCAVGAMMGACALMKLVPLWHVLPFAVFAAVGIFVGERR